MKKLLLVIIAILTLTLTACAADQSTDDGAIVLSSLTAAEIAAYFESAGLPITNIVDYNEETDVYHGLTRAESYTSKVLFADSRLEQSGAKAPVGGSIEVFETADLAAARADYINLIFDVMPTSGEYIFLLDNVLLRVDRALIDEEAAEYQTVLESLAAGQLLVLDSAAGQQPAE